MTIKGDKRAPLALTATYRIAFCKDCTWRAFRANKKEAEREAEAHNRDTQHDTRVSLEYSTQLDGYTQHAVDHTTETHGATVYHNRIAAHRTDRVHQAIRQTQYNWCPTCRGWFEPIGTPAPAVQDSDTAPFPQLEAYRQLSARADECVRLCEAIAAFWGDGVCDAPIWPGAYLTDEDRPIRDVIRDAIKDADRS